MIFKWEFTLNIIWGALLSGYAPIIYHTQCVRIRLSDIIYCSWSVCWLRRYCRPVRCAGTIISHLLLCLYWSICHPFMLRSRTGSLGQRHRHLGHGPSPPPLCSRVDCGKSLLNTQQLESSERIRLRLRLNCQHVRHVTTSADTPYCGPCTWSDDITPRLMWNRRLCLFVLCYVG